MEQGSCETRLSVTTINLQLILDILCVPLYTFAKLKCCLQTFNPTKITVAPTFIVD